MKYKLRRTRKNKARRYTGGANNNNENNRNNNNANNNNANNVNNLNVANNNNENDNHQYHIESGDVELIESLANADLGWIQANIESGYLDPNGEYELTFYKTYGRRWENISMIGQVDDVVYTGTPLGFLGALVAGFEFPIQQNLLTDANTLAVFDLLIKNGADISEQYFQSGTMKYLIPNLFFFGGKEAIIKKIFSIQLKMNEGWDHWSMYPHIWDIDDLERNLRRLPPNQKKKWINTLRKQQEKFKLASWLQNKIKTNKTRRAKLNVAEELSYLPPNPKTGFPGGNVYRKLAEEWKGHFKNGSS